MRVLCIIQARMESSRFPGKTLKKIGNQPLLFYVVKAAQSSKLINKVVIATSKNTADDLIEKFSREIGVSCIRESPSENVIKRYFKAANIFKSDYVVRITGDCPLIAFDVIDEVIEFALRNDLEYCSNTEPYSLPEGNDVEIFKSKILLKCYEEAKSKPEKEHVTLWMKRNKTLNKKNFLHKRSNNVGVHLSVDQENEFDMVSLIFQELNKIGINHSPTLAQVEAIITKINLPKFSGIMNEGYYKSYLDEAFQKCALPLKIDKSESLLKRSNEVIPGGAQTYSKSWMHHIRGVTPIFLKRGYGSYVEDVDGNIFVDLIQGLLPNILGYGCEEVNKAANNQAENGHSFSLPTEVEVNLAEKLCKIIPCAEKVRFGKNGSDATAGAVRAARAYSGKDRVAVCGYHGWQDWFIGSTSRNIGVPNDVSKLVSKFEYGNIKSLEKELDKYSGKFAAVIMEPINFDWSYPDFLSQVRKLCDEREVILIFDEICSGFHFGLGGAQKIFNVLPDMATFGKALGNGWPISCIVGREKYMNVFEDAFFSFTFAGDTACMAASLKVLDLLENSNAYEKMTNAGTKLKDGANYFAKKCGFGDVFFLEGHPHWIKFEFKSLHPYTSDQLRTFWVQEVTRRGVLILTTFNINASLEEKEIDICLKAFSSAFRSLQEIVENKKDINEFIDGLPAIPAFSAR